MIAASLGLKDEGGALVASVTANSPAAKAGVKQGDVIAAAGGRQIKAVHDLPRLVAATPPGQKLDLTIRRDGKESTVAATRLGTMPEQPEAGRRRPGPGPER